MKRKNLRQITAFCLVWFLVFPCFGYDNTKLLSETVYAEETEELGDYKNYSDSSEVDVEIPSAYPASYLDKTSIRGYLSEYVPPTRDQGDYANCSIHAATALAELYAIRHMGMKASKTDFSERHLLRCMFDFNENTTDEEEVGYINSGGAVSHVIFAWSKWQGIADEAIAPYPKTKNGVTPINPSAEWTDESLTTNLVRLSNYYELSLSENIKEIKETIMRNGGVGTGIASDKPLSSFDAIMNGTTWFQNDNSAFYTFGEGFPNHDVVIIGWDDDYPKENFKTMPSSDGAWLVRNSWERSSLNLFGRDTYYWVSYEEQSLPGTVDVFNFQKKSEWMDNNYYYDNIWSGDRGAAGPDDTWYGRTYCSDGIYRVPERGVNLYKGSNVFIANGDGGNEILSSVSFVCLEMDKNYSIQIFKGLSENSLPDEGILVSLTNGIINYSGAEYLTVDLDTPVILKKGERFSVVITLDDGNSCVPWSNSFGPRGRVDTPACAALMPSNERSYYKINDTWYNNWQNELTGEDKTLCISAQTLNMPTLSASPNPVNNSVELTWKRI